ncbi:MAG TPA: hypothetical protein VKE42_07385 [Candidatus Cybelea sp.]|nr:hypothetical protein [Candidatus Cybelea sp.]
MTNRHERKAAKLGDVVELKLGRVVFDIKPGEDTSKDICFVCGKPATAWAFPERGGMAHGFASISGQIVLLCETCFGTDDIDSVIMRKHLNAPDLKISEGGTYEDIDEIREIGDAIKQRDDKPTN